MQELKRVDERELNQRVKYVRELSKEIPFYVRKYKELRIDPDEIRSPEDLLKAYEKGLYTTPQDLPELVYYKHPEAKGPFYTSGISGKPKEVWVNPDDKIMMVPKFARALKVIAEKDRTLNCLPKEPAISGYIMNHVLSSLEYQFIHAPAQEVGTDIQRFLEYYKKIQPTLLIGLTTFLYRLPLRLEQIGIDSKNLGIKSLVIGAEPSDIERRKHIGNEFDALIYDWYVTSETYGMAAYEVESYSNKYLVTYPETLLFLTKDHNSVSENEIGNVVFTNLYPPTTKPWMILINYKIGDWAKCIEKKDNGIVTSISEIRREAAYLAGAKLNPQEVEKAIEELEDYKKELTGEYFIVTYSDSQRRAIAEVRIEGRKNLSLEDKKKIDKRIRERIYSANFPVWNEVENTKNARLLIEVTNPGELYKEYEQYIRPGKPKRLLVLTYV
jgi:phenylacetate-CoA ligase